MAKFSNIEKQLRFAREYVIDHNGTQAAIRAGYSEKTAAQAGSRLLTNLRVQQMIAELERDINDNLGIDATFVRAGLKRMAEFDVGEAYGPDGCLLAIHEMPKHVRQIIGGITTKDLFEDNPHGTGKVKTATTVDIKLPDRLKAFELLGKDVGMFKDKQEIDQNINVKIIRFSEEAGNAGTDPAV